MGELVAEILRQVVARRAEWDALLDRVPPSDWLEPLEPGGWTLKDLAAHVAWYEREVIPAFLTHVMEGSELWLLPLEQRNQAIYELNRQRTLEDVQAESTAVFQRFVAAVQTLDDADLDDPARFQYMPLDWKPYMLITTNSTEHYEDHIAYVRAWLEKKG